MYTQKITKPIEQGIITTKYYDFRIADPPKKLEA
jgi:hypothetical protein